MTQEELFPLRQWPVQQHDPDRVVATAEVNGVPGFVAPEFIEAEAGLSIGIAELHQYAGLSGGHKGIAIGCGGRKTISALHHRDRILSEGVSVGQLEGNPFRHIIDELGRAANSRYALVWSPVLERWFFGEPAEVLSSIHDKLSPWQWVEHPFEELVLSAPLAKSRSFYQASRAATYLTSSPAPALKEGGTIYLEASLEEGLGSESGFVAALRERKSWEELIVGQPPQGAGAQRAVMLALLFKKYRLKLCGVLDPAPFLSVGIDAVTTPAPKSIFRVKDPFSQIPQWSQ